MRLKKLLRRLMTILIIVNINKHVHFLSQPTDNHAVHIPLDPLGRLRETWSEIMELAERDAKIPKTRTRSRSKTKTRGNRVKDRRLAHDLLKHMNVPLRPFPEDEGEDDDSVVRGWMKSLWASGKCVLCGVPESKENESLAAYLVRMEFTWADASVDTSEGGIDAQREAARKRVVSSLDARAARRAGESFATTTTTSDDAALEHDPETVRLLTDGLLVEELLYVSMCKWLGRYVPATEAGPGSSRTVLARPGQWDHQNQLGVFSSNASTPTSTTGGNVSGRVLTTETRKWVREMVQRVLYGETWNGPISSYQLRMFNAWWKTASKDLIYFKRGSYVHVPATEGGTRRQVRGPVFILPCVCHVQPPSDLLGKDRVVKLRDAASVVYPSVLSAVDMAITLKNSRSSDTASTTTSSTSTGGTAAYAAAGSAGPTSTPTNSQQHLAGLVAQILSPRPLSAPLAPRSPRGSPPVSSTATTAAMSAAASATMLGLPPPSTLPSTTRPARAPLRVPPVSASSDAAHDAASDLSVAVVTLLESANAANTSLLTNAVQVLGLLQARVIVFRERVYRDLLLSKSIAERTLTISMWGSTLQYDLDSLIHSLTSAMSDKFTRACHHLAQTLVENGLQLQRDSSLLAVQMERLQSARQTLTLDPETIPELERHIAFLNKSVDSSLSGMLSIIDTVTLLYTATAKLCLPTPSAPTLSTTVATTTTSTPSTTSTTTTPSTNATTSSATNLATRLASPSPSPRTSAISATASSVSATSRTASGPRHSLGPRLSPSLLVTTDDVPLDVPVDDAPTEMDTTSRRSHERRKRSRGALQAAEMQEPKSAESVAGSFPTTLPSPTKRPKTLISKVTSAVTSDTTSNVRSSTTLSTTRVPSRVATRSTTRASAVQDEINLITACQSSADLAIITPKVFSASPCVSPNAPTSLPSPPLPPPLSSRPSPVSPQYNVDYDEAIATALRQARETQERNGDNDYPGQTVLSSVFPNVFGALELAVIEADRNSIIYTPPDPDQRSAAEAAVARARDVMSWTFREGQESRLSVMYALTRSGTSQSLTSKTFYHASGQLDDELVNTFLTLLQRVVHENLDPEAQVPAVSIWKRCGGGEGGRLVWISNSLLSSKLVAAFSTPLMPHEEILALRQEQWQRRLNKKDADALTRVRIKEHEQKVASGKKNAVGQLVRWTKNIPLADLDNIVFPAHIGGNHWVLVVVDFTEKTITTFDSRVDEQGKTEEMAGYVRAWLDIALDTKVEWTLDLRHDVPQQRGEDGAYNGLDCGVFTLANAVCVLGGEPVGPDTFGVCHVERLRLLIVAFLVLHETPPPGPTLPSSNTSTTTTTTTTTANGRPKRSGKGKRKT